MQEPPFTVDSLTEICRNTLTTPFDEKIIGLEGFYSPGQNKKYGNVYYDTLHDENKLSKFTLVVPEKIREYLKPKQYYVFEGHLIKTINSINDGTIRLLFRVTKLKDKKDEFQFISKDEFSVVQERFKRPIPFLDQLLLDRISNGQKPLINIITGNNSIVGEDYRNQLIDSDFYVINEHLVNLSNTTDLEKKIKQLSKQESDLLVVMRGGGSGLEIFNDVKLCQASLECSMAFATAIGHMEDVTLLEKCADKGFATPTAFGSFLQKIVEQHRGQIKERTGLEERITLLEKDLNTIVKDRDERLLKAEKSIKAEVLRGQTDRDKLEQIFKNREKLYLYTVLSITFLLVVCLLIIFL
ncbi:exodeoxyribonuclease VII large subunit [Maribacter aestuarii]|uniref:exodeoxyribonuclease VII large subunit n=1 Tax=Maribacter aestuarii TaxID=1130723 RepID=UPI0025A5CE21|nr:exodeoxyribonuclease VII large subunit [Maribacter aestuarii]